MLSLQATLHFAPAAAPASPIQQLHFVQPPGGEEPCLLALGGQPADQPTELTTLTSLQVVI